MKRILSILVLLTALCANAAPSTVYTYDARPLRKLNLREPAAARQLWDTLHVLAALQGLANRDEARFYLFFCSEFGVDTDQFWFDWFRGEDGWLRGSTVQTLTGVEEAITVFRTAFEGLVVYDPAVPATSDVASTAAGCDRLLPVRYDPAPGSIFNLLTRQLKLPVKLWLVNEDGTSKFTGRGTVPDIGGPSSGSAKVDACRWALARYVRSGRCAPGLAAYYVDVFWIQTAHHAGPEMNTVLNHDYFIARRAFFFDLSPWADETPNDDPKQRLGLDREAFFEVMRGLYDHARGGIIKVGGFIPWPFKYTDAGGVGGKHGGVPTEWEFGRLISQYNGYMEADAAGLAGMANASFFQHYPLAARYRQPNPKPVRADWERKGFVTREGRVTPRLYVGHYVGDYDAPSWLYKAVPTLFRHPARGSVPLGWAFNPGLADRAPQALVYAYRHATSNDFFITGDSGPGYLNVPALTHRPESHLPSGLAAWAAYCRERYARWDMTITGFMLDGSSGSSGAAEFEAYRGFSPDGIGTHFEKGPRMWAGIPTCPERDLPDNAAAAAAQIADRAARAINQQPAFLWARSILKSPAWYADVSRLLREQHPGVPVEIVDPYTFFGLIRLQLETAIVPSS